MVHTATKFSSRLEGLDAARFFAFSGMVFVNFHVVMSLGEGAPWTHFLFAVLEGKAAATFVVLAGIGLTFGARRGNDWDYRKRMLRRAGFLMALGLLNSLIFPADILHYYAVYFVFGLFFVGLLTRWVALAAGILPIVFLLLLVVLNYEAEWNWTTLDYEGFWTPLGFLKNLMFNGWHPVVPWLSFLLLGMILGRAKLGDAAFQAKMIMFGAAGLAVAYVLSTILSADPELAELAGVGPIPPGPLFVLAGSSAALIVIGACNWIVARMPKIFAFAVITGRQALTLYIAHIILGMGIMEAFGLIGTQTNESSIVATLLFVGLSIFYAFAWHKCAAPITAAGPLEGLMRRIAG